MFKKYLKFIKIVFLLKIKLNFLMKSKIVYYNHSRLELLKWYVDENIILLDPLKEVYFFTLIKSFFKYPFQNIMISYMKTFLQDVNPKFFFTFIDNDFKFYLLKNYFKDIVFVSIQNGQRGGVTEKINQNNKLIFDSNVPVPKKMKADCIFTINETASKKFSKYVKTKTIVIGSYANNIAQKNPNIEKKTLSFISQIYDNKSNEFFFDNNKDKITWDDYYLAEKKVLLFLGQYCQRNNLKFQIIPRTNKNGEYEFYRKLFNNKYDWNYPKKKDIFSSYELIDKSSFVVGIDGTMVYEALARKKKIAIISIRDAILSNKYGNLQFKQFNFGWPSKLDEKGPFWTHFDEISEFERILKFITTVNDKNWGNLIMNKKLSLIIPPYDKNNSKFVNFLKKLKIKINEKNIKFSK